MESIEEHERLIKPIKTEYKVIMFRLQDPIYVPYDKRPENYDENDETTKQYGKPYWSPYFYWLDEGEDEDVKADINRWHFNIKMGAFRQLGYYIQMIKTEYGIDDKHKKNFNLHLVQEKFMNDYKNREKNENLKKEIKCDCGGTYRYTTKQRHLNNKIHKDYERTGVVWCKPTEPYNPKEKIECKCGGKYTISNKSKHDLTTKHIEFMKKDESTNKNDDDEDDDRFVIID
jgi:hypothetical protein